MPSTKPTPPITVLDEPTPATGPVSPSGNGASRPTTARNGSANGAASGAAVSAHPRAASSNGGATLPGEVLDELVVRIAGRDEGDAIADLAARAGSTRPEGALMVGAVRDRVLAAVSIRSGEALSELTPAGTAAAAAARYRVAELARRAR